MLCGLTAISSPLYASIDADSGENTYSYYKKLSNQYYQKQDYKQACYYLQLSDSLQDIRHQAEMSEVWERYFRLQKEIEYSEVIQAKESLKNTRINRGIIIFALVDVLGLIAFLYLEKQRAYLQLVRKNVEWANQSHSYKPVITVSEENIATSDSQMMELESKDKELLLKLIHLFKTEKIYLKCDITIVDIAKLLASNKTIVSKIINTYFQKSFPALLNEYRIKEAIHLLTDTRTSIYKLEAIGEMCGYKNRQVFHTTFKKMTGVTPNDFRKMSFSKEFDEE
jgi:YesN/AraC family two-component response regulator